MRHIVAILTLQMFLAAGLAAAQPAEQPVKKGGRPNLSGEITLESTEGNVKLPYQAAQDLGIEYAEKVQAAVNQGATGKVPPIDDRAAPFLNAAYLYCSVQRGVCQHFLDTLLEGDLINSKLGGTVECPTLTKFWKSYIAGDLDSRHRFQTPIAFVAVSEEFAQKTRPRYLKCKETIKNEIEGAGGDYFSKRYADGSKAAQITKTVEFLRGLKAENKNVFLEVGISLK